MQGAWILSGSLGLHSGMLCKAAFLHACSILLAEQQDLLNSFTLQGVLYSHRSNFLQSFTMAMPDASCLTSATTVLAIVPLVSSFLPCLS